MPSRDEPVSHTEATGPTQPMPVVGELIMVMERMYRCVSVQYLDARETGTVPELRVRFREEHNLAAV
jgi:hypothetical protein